MSRAGVLGLTVVVLASVACEQDFEPPDRAVRVERAAAEYSHALFDSVAWVDDGVRLSEGNAVYAERCRRCHGTLGRGDTDYAHERDLVVPSLVAPQWRFSELDSLRRKIYIGHESGMPVFGDGLLDPRQIDATAAYILLTLRADALERDP